MEAESKVILITGTSKGIGKYLSEYYLEKNCFVYGCSRKPSEIESKNYRHFCLDVCDEKEVMKLFLNIRNESKKLDILINNAGIASMNHFLLTPLNTMTDIMNTNVIGAFLFTREAAKLMRKNSFGRIINFSSVAVQLDLAGEAVYASSKAALNSFTKITAKEFAEFNITVNAIALTPMRTDLIKNVPEEKINKLIGKLTVKRLMEFKDISNLTDFLIREESGFITGQIINFGGI
ncbi:MAG: SDR family oxidoreductase [Bacteroidetes bacterium]|nr:SDR family oxidoreductase [Bacteroidota bacterium]